MFTDVRVAEFGEAGARQRWASPESSHGDALKKCIHTDYWIAVGSRRSAWTDDMFILPSSFSTSFLERLQIFPS